MIKDNENDPTTSKLKELADGFEAGFTGISKADGLKQYPDGSIRDAKGHFAAKTGTIPGTPGVEKAIDLIKTDPKYQEYVVLGTEISVKSSKDIIRRYDIVCRKPGNKIVGIEVKSGSATRTPQQKEIDAELMERKGLPTTGEKARSIGVAKIDTVEVIKVE